MRGTAISLLVLALVGGLWGGEAEAARGRARDQHATTSLEIVYSTKSFNGPTMTYRLRCDPASGTMPHSKAVCAALKPGMIPGARGRPEGLCALPPLPVVIQPAPTYSLSIAGTFRGQSIGGQACFDEQAWLQFLPSNSWLARVRVDRGLGPLNLGESEASVRELLGKPKEVRHGLQIYATGDVEQVTGAAAVPVVFAVGFARSGRVSTLLDNDYGLSLLGGHPTVTPRTGSPLRRWHSVACGSHRALADHRPVPGVATTVVLPLLPQLPTVIVSSAPDEACAAAARTGPLPTTGRHGTPSVSVKATFREPAGRRVIVARWGSDGSRGR